MELLLLEDIPGIGRRNDIVIVNNGFALNNLLPRRRALVATPTVRKRYAEQIRRRAEEKTREAELARNAASLLKTRMLLFKRRTTKAGKLYAGISARDIADALSEQLQIEVPEVNIHLSEAIKSLGEHTVQMKLAETTVDVKLDVQAEE
jgi:large subunit ribosomal protein L9